ncbi:hypothetical protein BDP27DRAFT_1237027, partial [Rhodocollybia butyracea]
CQNPKHGARRYQDKGDRLSTSNLRKHAIQCFSKDAVEAAIAGAPLSQLDGSIFAAFGRQGAKPVTVTHWAHTNAQIWYLMLAGRPQAVLPGRHTVVCDIKKSFERCEQRINTLLQVLMYFIGRLSFATDAWTSPNHRAMAAWTVHLQHKGSPRLHLCFCWMCSRSHRYSIFNHRSTIQHI